MSHHLAAIPHVWLRYINKLSTYLLINMGLLPNSGILSYKWLNAKIKDEGGRLEFVWVKNYFGDKFVTTINQKPYVFKVVAADVGIYDKWGIKKYRIADYSTKHYRPISDKTDKIKELLRDNGLGKINRPLFDVLKTLGKREKKDFEKHEIQTLLDELSKAKESKLGEILGHEPKYAKARESVIEFLQSLDVKEIVTPTREIAEYIEEDLITTDPGYGGDIITTHQRTDLEHKKITNTPIGPKRPFGILLAIIFGIMLAAVGVYLLYDNGTFDDITGMLPNFDSVGNAFNNAANPPPSISGVSQYPTPEAAKAAIDSGQAKLSDFPPEIQSLIKAVKTPSVSP